MREIWLSDRPHHLRKNFFLELEAYTLYPDDEPSLRQALFLLEDEYRRYQSMNSSEYAPSRLVRSVLTSNENTIGQRFTCGAVAIAMCALDSAGKRMSLEAASHVIEHFNGEADKLPFDVWRGGEWGKVSQRLIADQAGIKAAFRKYRSVAHILAAALAAGGYLEVMEDPFDRSLEADICFLSTALFFQHHLRKVGNFANWNIWEIRVSEPYNPADYPPLMPTPELITNLLRPWHEATQR